MKKTSILLVISLFALLVYSCNDSNSSNNVDDHSSNNTVNVDDNTTDDNTDIDVVTDDKTVAEILVGGSWYCDESISGEDVIFNEDGTMFFRFGTDEGESTWEVIDESSLMMYSIEYEIVEISDEKLVVSDGANVSTYTRIVD